MLIPILIEARDNASNALRSVAASFQGLTSSANSAAQAAGNVSIKETGAAKIAALKNEINASTQSLRTNSAAESLRSSKANLNIAENLVGERRRQPQRSRAGRGSRARYGHDRGDARGSRGLAKFGRSGDPGRRGTR